MSSPPARGESVYPEELVGKAIELNLYRDREWEVLLHYARGHLGKFRSRISDPKFFLSPSGKEEPQRELEQTIRSLFLPATKDADHALCRFPARAAFLRKRLGIDPARLPLVTCTDRDVLFETVDPRAAVLVFPVGHINSPASMFGHTLIRIDGKSRSSLISYAANYAAHTTDANGLVYAWKGIFGGYRGYYSLLPYYLKVKEYGDLEHRDIWEYPLKLSEYEVKRMLAHLWELQNISSDYYFFDENCSYNLLFLIEAARPELRLAERTGPWVIPSDTIDIAVQNGVVEAAKYRPSQGTRIEYLSSQLPKTGREQAFHIARGEASPTDALTTNLSSPQQRRVLDLAAEFLQYRFVRKELDQESFNRSYLKILAQRSQMGADQGTNEEVAEPSPPEAGHGSALVAAGIGVRRGEGYLEWQARPGYHGLLDPDQGYLKGAQIKFLEGAVRYNLSRDELQLKSLHFVDIISLAPRDLFFRPYSWKVLAGADREPMRNGQDALLFRVDTGGGFAYRSPLNGISYALGELDLNCGEKIRGTGSAGVALTVGDMEQFGEWWKVQLSLRGALYEVGDDRRLLKAAVSQNFRITRNNSITLTLSREYVNGHGISEGGLFWNRYF